MVMAELEKYPRCTYHRLPNGIHTLILESVTREKVDELTVHVELLLANRKTTECVPILIDNTFLKNQSLQYTFDRMGTFLNKHPAPINPNRVALLHNDPSVNGNFDTFMQSIPANTVELRLFTSDERAQAIQWLLEP